MRQRRLLVLFAFSFAAVFVVLGTSTPADAAHPPTYVPPVAAPVSDPFRPPEHFAGRGNRGLEYDTTPGQAVVASADGRVAFSGRVGGRLVVSIDHADGLRTTYTRLQRITVRAGETVEQGGVVGTADTRFHFGVRAGRAYLDPSILFAASGGRPRLVPVRRSAKSR